MSVSDSPAFVSYSHADRDFALRLATDLKSAGALVWIDRLDILPGVSWDNAIEDALLVAPEMILILSPTSAKSENVRDEISYALHHGKSIIPIFYLDCEVPLRLQRKQRIDFRINYANGLRALLTYMRSTGHDVVIPVTTVGERGLKTFPPPSALKPDTSVVALPSDAATQNATPLLIPAEDKARAVRKLMRETGTPFDPPAPEPFVASPQPPEKAKPSATTHAFAERKDAETGRQRAKDEAKAKRKKRIVLAISLGTAAVVLVCLGMWVSSLEHRKESLPVSHAPTSLPTPSLHANTTASMLVEQADSAKARGDTNEALSLYGQACAVGNATGCARQRAILHVIGNNYRGQPAEATTASATKPNAAELNAQALAAEGSRLLQVLDSHAEIVESVAFSPDGRTLASGDTNNQVRLWDVASAQALQSLRGHTSWVKCVVFNANGRTLASGSKDGTPLVPSQF